MGEVTRLGRRSFLQGVAAASVWTAACGKDDAAAPALDPGLADGGVVDAPGPTVGAPDPPFSTWRAMREALGASPDALVDRGNALVRAKDPKAIFTFVRDATGTVPPPDSISTATGVRWGVRATLRGGLGTPRERVELLASLLARAGFAAKVMVGDADGALLAPTAVDKIYLRATGADFAPTAPSPPDRWVRELTGAGDAPQPTDVDANDAKAGALADALLALLPTGATANGFTLAVFKVPLVELTLDGAPVLLNPLLPDAEWGSAYAANVVPAAPVVYPPVVARLLVARTHAPNERVEIAKATYGADQVAGRVIVAHTPPMGDVGGQLARRYDDLSIFQSVLWVGGSDVTRDEARTLARPGSLIAACGDVYAKASDGSVSCNGISLGNQTPSTATTATAVVVQAKATAFPDIELTVALTDAGGQPVLGATGAAFVVEEDGQRVQVTLRENGATGPRVLFVVDTTGSQPPMTATIANALAAAVFAGAPGARAQVVPATGGAAPTAAGFTLADATALGAALQVPGAVASNLYGALTAAESASPSLVVLLSDGDGQDTTSKDAALAALAGGAPVLAVRCAQSGSTAPTVDVMALAAQVSGGSVVDGGTLATIAPVATALENAVRARRAAPYRLAYRASRTGATTRTVKVTTTGASGTATYAIPATPLAASSIAGLYLEITTGGETTTRVLGGYAGGDASPSALVTAAADARLALLGSAMVVVDGHTPTASTAIADVLDARLGTESAARAARDGKLDETLRALGEATLPMARQLVPFANRSRDPAGVVSFVDSLRVVVLTQRPGRSLRSDVLPVTRFATASHGSPRDVFVANLRASASLAVAERAAFRSTTASLLDGHGLALLAPGGVSASDLPQFAAADRDRLLRVLAAYPNHHRFVAKDGSSLAFWAVHPSGSCLGVLPDGTGGGENPCDELKTLNTLLDILNFAGSVLGMPGIGIWVAIGQMVVLAGVETLLAFSDSPPIVTGDQQLAAITCTFGSAVLGEMPLPIKGEGFTINLVDTAKSYAVDTAVGSFKVCANPNPCK